jgi:hypothetical protein
MPLEHCCFISYRHHEDNELSQRFIQELCIALHNELSVRSELDIFVDRAGMRGGNFVDPKLARALCTSACMLVIYTPTYFSKNHTYCAREYRAMESLEQLRLERLAHPVGKEHGLIIPVVFRGADSLPAEISAKRHYYTFERFSLASRSLVKSPQFQPNIANLVQDIHLRMQMMGPMSDELTCDCDKFAFPSEDEVKIWLDKIITPVLPFPLRARTP